jgi:hypothetical protein
MVWRFFDWFCGIIMVYWEGKWFGNFLIGIVVLLWFYGQVLNYLIWYIGILMVL